MPTQGGYGYRPPTTGQAIGGALGGMADALMKISSMQSDRVNRAYTLARQNRLDDQALRRIENDSQRLILEAERNRATLNQQDLARERFEAGQANIEAQREQDAATTWYEMQRESGARIRTDEMGAPMATGEEIIQRISQGQPIADLTDRDYTESDPHRMAMTTDTATAAAEQERMQALIDQGIHPRTMMPFTPEEAANLEGEDYSTVLRASFPRTDEGRRQRLSEETLQAQSIAGAKGRAEEDPYATLGPEQRIQAGQIYVTDDLGNERWIDSGGQRWQPNVEVLWDRGQMDLRVPPPAGAFPIGGGAAPTGAPIGIPAAVVDQGFRSGGAGRGSLLGEQDIPGPLQAGAGGAMPDDMLQAGGPMPGDTLQAGAPAAGSWSIDRIEGDIAVLVADDGSGTTQVPLASLPPGSQEGSVLRNVGGGWVLDEEAGAAMGGLGAQDPGGALMLGAL